MKTGPPVKSVMLAAVASLMLVVSGTAWAGDIHVPEMRFEGLSRTKPDHLRSLVEECLEDQGRATLDAIDRPELEQCLMNSELFAEVGVTVGEDLLVTVRERWTLIPLPYFRSQADSTSFGFFLFETNLLGRGKRLGLGATFGSLGNSYLLFLRDPSIAQSDWTAMLYYRQETGDVFRYAGEEKVDGYRQKERVFAVAPGYRFTHRLEGQWFLSYTDRSYEQAESFETVPEDYRFWSTGLGLELDTTDFKFYFREGHEAKLRIMGQFGRSSGDPVSKYEFEWDWHRSFIGRNVAKLRLDSMGVDSDAVVDSFQLGGFHSLRGVQEKGLWAQYLTGAVLDYHIPFRSGRFGTWAAGPFFSYAIYKPAGTEEAEWQDTISYGLGLFFYLKKIAFPGVGVIAGRNEEFSGNFVSVQVGFSY
jgi:outer membrane protein assembly factor BamA